MIVIVVAIAAVIALVLHLFVICGLLFVTVVVIIMPEDMLLYVLSLAPMVKTSSFPMLVGIYFNTY